MKIQSIVAAAAALALSAGIASAQTKDAKCGKGSCSKVEQKKDAACGKGSCSKKDEKKEAACGKGSCSKKEAAKK